MSKKILVVDDEEDICEIVGDYIGDIVEGAHITSAHDGLEGFIASKGQKFDLIVTDMKMPFLNGKDFILAVRSKENQNTETPFIMLSGFLNSETISRLEEKGIICLSKPINLDGFAAAVKRSLEL